MEIILLVLSIICGLIGLIGCVIPALPGSPLTYLGMWLLQWSGYVTFSSKTLLIWAIIMVVVTLLDFLLAPWMTKLFGGSKAGTWGSTIGLIIGLIIPLPMFLGVILGPFLGAYIGEEYFSKQGTGRSLRAAFGAFLAFFVGTGLKLLSSIGMIASAFV